MFIVTMKARRKNAKRHIAGKCRHLTAAYTTALLLNKNYDVEVVNGAWKTVAIREKDNNGNFYMREV